MIDDRQEHRLPTDPEALEAVARLDGSDSAAAFLELLAPHVEAVGVQFDGLVSDREERLSNDPDILRSELAGMGFEEVEEAQRRIADWRSGRARSLRSPPARAAFEAMLPTLMRAVAAGPDPIRSAQPLRRHRRQAVERRKSLPAARREAEAGRPAGADPGPRGPACRAAWAEAHAARRADRRVELCSAAGRRETGGPFPGSIARRAVRHRARPAPANGRRTALRAGRAAAGGASRPDRHRRRI